jgi:hypothetical protein
MPTARPEQTPHFGLDSQLLYFQGYVRFCSISSSGNVGAPHAMLTKFVNLAMLAAWLGLKSMLPQRLKPRLILFACGAAEAAPFQNKLTRV